MSQAETDQHRPGGAGTIGYALDPVMVRGLALAHLIQPRLAHLIPASLAHLIPLGWLT